jgi:hypothetical protein
MVAALLAADYPAHESLAKEPGGGGKCYQENRHIVFPLSLPRLASLRCSAAGEPDNNSGDNQHKHDRV